MYAEIIILDLKQQIIYYLNVLIRFYSNTCQCKSRTKYIKKISTSL